MPQRPPTIAQRLRSIWSPAPGDTRLSGLRGTDGATTRHAGATKGSEFAERLRAAVDARH